MTRVLAVFAFGLVVWLSLSRSPLPGSWHNLVPDDIVKHLGMYTCLTLICLFARRQTGRGRGRPVLAILMGVAVMLEVLQVLTPSRQFHLEEMLANCAGVALGAGLARLLGRVWRSRYET